jgi:hypothetical protein
MDTIAIPIDTTATYNRTATTERGARFTVTTPGHAMAHEIRTFLDGPVYDSITQALDDTVTLAGTDSNGHWCTLTYTKQ